MKSQIYVILGMIILILISVFAVINVEGVRVNYLFWTGESPLILVILFSTLMGGLVTATAGGAKYIQLQREKKALIEDNKNKEKTLKKHGLLEKEVNRQTKKEGSEGKEREERK